jgi:cytochrome oxidase Cu insertion factor (SCO1/SenC/PrrC family)
MPLSPEASRRRGRRLLLALAAVAGLPVLASYLLFSSGWRPSGMANHGELLNPARPITDVELRTLEGAPARVSQLARKWALVYFAPPVCEEVCQRQLYHLRQVVLAQGKEQERVQRVLVLTDARSMEGVRALLKDYPGMQVWSGSKDTVAQLASQFAVPAGSPSGSRRGPRDRDGAVAVSPLDGLNRIYLLDPLGNLVLSYPPEADPTGLRKDLARLLRLSHIG